MTPDPTTPEGRAETRRVATDGWMIRPHRVLALFDALDDAECEIERQRGDLVIERRRAEAAEAELARLRAIANPPLRKYTAPGACAPSWAAALAFLEPESKILVSCTVNLVAVGEAEAFLEALLPSSIRSVRRANGGGEIELRNGSRIVFPGQAGRGHSQDWILIAEES